MALRARQQVNVVEQGHGPRKVEAKVFQGPTLHRAALGEMSNRSLTHLHAKPAKAPAKPGLLARKDGRTSFKRFSGKENSVPKGVTDKTLKAKEAEKAREEAEEGQMEVEGLAVAFSAQRLNVEDIDAQDTLNPQLVSEYVCDIYDYLRLLERASPVQQHHLEGQGITHRMRCILVDWLVQVHHRFTLQQETLFLTVGILDRFLQVERNTERDKLQLVGVTAMFIASKYEEMMCPDVGDFAYITDKAYTKQEILKMEVNILKKLQFNVSFPLPLHFLRRNSKAGMVDCKHHTLAKYLIELCLPEYTMCHFRPSLLAAAALCLTLRLLDGGEWSDTLVYYSTYTEDQLMPVMCKLAAVVVKSHHSKQQAVRQKYEANKLMRISKLPQLKSDIITKLAERSALA